MSVYGIKFMNKYQNNNTICTLLSKSLCDKHFMHNDPNVQGITRHKYGPIYDLVFSSIAFKQQRKLNILEIGVSTGISLQIRANLPYVNTVVGADIITPTLDLPTNVTFYNQDAYNIDFITKLKETHGLFDIIIDDGPHSWESQNFFLNNYFQLLNPGGVLLCEDMHSSYMHELVKLRDSLHICIFDLRSNYTEDDNDIIALRFNDDIY